MRWKRKASCPWLNHSRRARIRFAHERGQNFLARHAARGAAAHPADALVRPAQPLVSRLRAFSARHGCGRGAGVLGRDREVGAGEARVSRGRRGVGRGGGRGESGDGAGGVLQGERAQAGRARRGGERFAAAVARGVAGAGGVSRARAPQARCAHLRGEVPRLPLGLPHAGGADRRSVESAGSREHRFETFCYGPKSCPAYRAGPTRKVPGRKGMRWEEEDWVDEEATAHRGADE